MEQLALAYSKQYQPCLMCMYAKLFASLYNGTLRGRANPILVFTNLLAHADRHGYVDMHFTAISDEVGISVDEVKSAILELEAPDSESRSPDENGRRLIRLDEHRAWGWRIVNAKKYREIRNEEERREQNRLNQAEYRKRKSAEVSSRQRMSGVSAHTDADADADAEADRSNKGIIGRQVVESPPGFPKSEAEAISAADKIGVPAEFAAGYYNLAVGRGYCDSKGVQLRSWPHAVKAVYEISKSTHIERATAAAARAEKPLTVLDLKTIRDTKLARAQELRKFRSETAAGHCWTADDKRLEYNQVNKEIRDLNRRIEAMA